MSGLDQELTRVNLMRARWLIWAGIAFTLASIAVTRLAPEQWSPTVRWVLWVDLISAFAALGWIRWAQERMRLANATVIVLVVVFLGYMDAYFFALLADVGQNPNYVIGVVVVGALFLFRPEVLLPLFAVNHAIFCLVLLLNPKGPVVLILVQNSLGAVIGALTGWLLFRARREEYGLRMELENRNVQLNDLMAVTAHDLRSPLLGVRDLISLAKREAGGNTRLEKILEQAHGSCAQMVEFAGRLLASHAAEETAKKGAAVAGVDLCEVAREAANRFPLAEVACAFPETKAEIFANREALAQVLENLLGNAVRFSPVVGSVEARVVRGRGSWICEVRDQGPGVDAGEEGAVFGKFFRGARQAEEKANKGGAGLGLFIVATTTRGMGGKFGYRANVPRGAVFWVEFPNKSREEGE